MANCTCGWIQGHASGCPRWMVDREETLKSYDEALSECTCGDLVAPGECFCSLIREGEKAKKELAAAQGKLLELADAFRRCALIVADLGHGHDCPADRGWRLGGPADCACAKGQLATALGIAAEILAEPEETDG